MRADVELIAVAHDDVHEGVHQNVEVDVGETTTEAVPAPARKPAPARRQRGHWFTLRRGISVSSYRLLALGGFAALFALWAWASHRESMNPVFVPTPEDVLRAARALFADEKLWMDLKLSIFRVTAGFLLAAAVGVPLGLWMGSFKVVEAVTQPIVEFVRYVPVPALIPILMVLF
ncbi:MAG TPA: hypothetical protein VLA79_15800, partial [Polyangia bacterium]|nr:hypothetical protein [Polyangia bacterium]